MIGIATTITVHFDQSWLTATMMPSTTAIQSAILTRRLARRTACACAVLDQLALERTVGRHASTVPSGAVARCAELRAAAAAASSSAC